jgi:hypothetical protein
LSVADEHLTSTDPALGNVTGSANDTAVAA